MNFTNIINDFNHPPTRHAMFVHLPIVLSMMGVPLTLAAALLRKNMTLRVLTAILYAGLIIDAFVTTNSGSNAESALGALSPDVQTILDNHESMADKVWLFALLTLALSACAFQKHVGLRIASSWLAVVASVITFGWIAQTANYGGTLVYRHGVGITAQASATTTAPAERGKPSAVAILSENCIKCHNPTRVEAGKSGRLDQTTLDGLLKGGNSGPAIVPGKPDQSLLIERIATDDDDSRMPPGRRLTNEQIDALKEWIREGAPWNAVSVPNRR